MKIDKKYQPILLEALEELMYKTSLQLEALKGQPLTQRRKELSARQKRIETLQHLISIANL